MLVLGIDPGSRVTGYGLIEKEGSSLSYVHAGQISPPGDVPFHDRIYHIYRAMTEIMASRRPGELAIEDIFYAKNVKSSLKLGHARAAVLIAAVENGLKIYDYSPLEIKKSVVGYGRASKEQVRSMVRLILGLREVPTLDTTDALAAAICHLNWSRFTSARGS